MSERASFIHLRAAQVVDWGGTSPAGAVLNNVYIGHDPDGLGIQIAVASVESTPTAQLRQKLHALRKGNRAITLIVAATDGTSVWLQGPDASAAWDAMPVDRALRQLQSVLDEPDSTAAFNHIAALRRQVETGGVGWTNNGLFAKYHLEHNVSGRSDWTTKGEQAKALRDLRGQRLIEALGFRATSGPGGSLILTAAEGDSDAPQAVAVLLDEAEHFDAKSPRYQLTPIAFALAVAQRRELPWVIGLRRDHIRLYPGKDGIGVGQKGQVETYFEIDLPAIDDSQIALLALVFTAAALAKDGTADELLRDSARYATGLGNRLRQRIYDGVVPPIAKAVAERLPSIGRTIDANGLEIAYKLTLRILFRLLFQAYAEDRGLLPYGRSEGYTANSLKTIAQRNLDVDETDFGDAASIWLDLVQVWNAIDQGNKQWQVPAYNGGLFAADDGPNEEGALLARLSLPDSVLGPALQHLLVDFTPEGTPGPVDFRALSVREFGTIYEGLLESSLSIADADLTTDKNGAWIPAGKGNTVEAERGTVYFHGASGERKATGSYFTPKVVVDHLIERSIIPALNNHLDTIAAKLAKGKQVSRAEFFDFRVADLAMGSGHFLVAAVDKIEALMRTFLTEHDVPDVRDELLKIASVARHALGDDEVAKSEVEEVGLLRRQVARRCIYGLDINPLAVELARLALWIHTFVPGLPMSNLDHGLVCANSLTGIGTIDEAIDSLVGAPEGRGAAKGVTASDGGFDFDVEGGRQESGHQLMVRKAVTDYLLASLPLLADVANASEASKAEVQRAAELLAEAKEKALPAKRIFDAAVAVRLGEWSASITKEEHVSRLVETGEPTAIVAPLNPAHMPVLFPEVFVRENPGFDVLVGNPPWEELVYEEMKFWTLRFPGLKGQAAERQTALIDRYRSERPDLVAAMEVEREAADGLRRVLAGGPFPGLETGNADLYKAFCWRFIALTRQRGRFAVVLPRSATSALGTVAWRRAVLDLGRFASVTTLVNKNKWVFPSVHGQYSIALVVAEIGQRGPTLLSGPFSDAGSLADMDANQPVVVSPADLVAWSESLSFPLLPTPQSAGTFLQLRAAPSLARIRQDLDFRPVQGDFNQTTDAGLWTVGDFSKELPVMKGASFDLWSPGGGRLHGSTRLATVMPRASEKIRRQARMSSSAFYQVDAEQLLATGAMPFQVPRIAFRDIARATDTRTVITALVPAAVLTNKAPFLFDTHGDPSKQAYVLGILSSIPLDWYARRFVELSLNFFILKSFPIPPYEPDKLLAKRVVHVAGRLAAVDGRYREWGAKVGVEVGTATDEPVKSDLIAELDALVSLLYGLNEDQVTHVFATFHRGWDYQNRLDAVLEHYAKWKGTA